MLWNQVGITIGSQYTAAAVLRNTKVFEPLRAPAAAFNHSLNASHSLLTCIATGDPSQIWLDSLSKVLMGSIGQVNVCFA